MDDVSNLIVGLRFGVVMVAIHSWSRFDQPSYHTGSEHFARYKPRFATSHALYARANWAYVGAVVVICDSAAIAARREVEQIAKLIKRISHKSEAQARGRIVFWDEIAETAEFVAFASRLQKEVLADDMLAETIEKFVCGRVDRFGLGAAPDRERDYEREYLLSEVCMSVYCTEMLRYSTEVWERPPARDVPDPLNLLYDERKELIERVIGRPATRVLGFLNSDVHFPALSDPEMIRLD